MITRTAIFEGRIKTGMEDRFFAEVKDRLVPLWRKFPHATNIRLLRVAAADEDALPIAMIQQIEYPSMEALHEAISSPVRAQARAATLEIMEMFDGRFYHVMSEGDIASEEGGGH